MKVIIKDKVTKTFTTGMYSTFTRRDENFNIIKEDGTRLEESTNIDTNIDEYYGLEWELKDIIKLLEFLGIEYELQEETENIFEKE